MSALVITKEILINVIPEMVFDALTSSDEIIKYFPLKEVVSDWKEGSEILLKGEANGECFTDYGVIEILDYPNKFKYRYWSDNHGTERVPENFLTIAYTLDAIGSETNLKLEHSHFKSVDMFNMMDDVWDFLLGSLKAYAERSV